jgi:uncharacterized protein (TIGR00369 family)
LRCGFWHGPRQSLSLRTKEIVLKSFGVEIPFVTHLGFTLHRMERGESELRYEAKPEHLNSFDVTHGGASMTLLDVTMATAARSDTPDMGVVTIEMKTSFMQPAKGLLVAKGRLIHRTATLAFTEGTVYDAAGRICSHATGTFKYVKRLPVDGRNINQLKAVSTD